ncbi:hypothetical protein IPG41_04145 [Candidatus Peregrinibacteria bacterium]|nr:MAG: hypothetical protein IPG41_04145 [Candidatus Peregrinibacteria bacterium]
MTEEDKPICDGLDASTECSPDVQCTALDLVRCDFSFRIVDAISRLSGMPILYTFDRQLERWQELSGRSMARKYRELLLEHMLQTMAVFSEQVKGFSDRTILLGSSFIGIERRLKSQQAWLVVLRNAIALAATVQNGLRAPAQASDPGKVPRASFDQVFVDTAEARISGLQNVLGDLFRTLNEEELRRTPTNGHGLTGVQRGCN